MKTTNMQSRTDVPTSPFVLIAATDAATQPSSAWLVDPQSHLLAPASPDQRHLPHASLIDNQQTLEPRLIKLLCMLAAEAGQVVERQRLIEALWPNVIVNENSLNRAVSDLRKALQGDGHSWIRTIPKRGYRLNATMRALSPAPSRAFPRLPRHQNNAWWRWTPTAAATVLLGISVLVQWAPDSEPLSGPQLATSADASLTPFVPLLQGSSRATVVNSHYLQNNEANFLHSGGPAGTREDVARFQLLLGDSEPAVNDDPPPAIMVTAHQLMAYVDRHDGISQLKLRHAFADDTPWVAFTTDEQIQHLQWSPLDDGLLFTVGKESREVGASSYMRLMLLDMETLSLHELYRRDITPKLEGGGKLT